MIRKPHAQVIAALICSFALLCATGCSPLITGAPRATEQSFNEEQLQNYNGQSYFPSTFTYEELLQQHEVQPGAQSAEGIFSKGAYIVGTSTQGGSSEKPKIEPGVYYLEGNQKQIGHIYVYTPAPDEPGKYQIQTPFSYLGFMLIQYNAGDAVFFIPPTDTATMYVASAKIQDSNKGQLKSGLYRVGVDIPAGTYTVTQEKESANAIAAEVEDYPTVNVYSSMVYTAATTLYTEQLPPLAKGARKIQVTVTDGQFLELYGCEAGSIQWMAA